VAITKAQEIYEEVERRIAAGTDKADAFKALAEETGRPFDSLRGSYYTHKRKLEGGESGAKPSRTRRRETTPDDALADARAALERAIDSIDREVEAAKARAEEAKAEYDALRASAADRKKAITERLEALR
jgi:chromosome segregation ATPase